MSEKKRQWIDGHLWIRSDELHTFAMEQKGPFVAVTEPQYEALMALPFWLLKLRSLGYISAGHGRKIADEALAIVKAAGIEIKPIANVTNALRSAGIHETEGGER